jgi:two-component system osmolarity sensor histidine kinase EnvZ
VRWLPNTSFGQTILLIGVLLLVNQVVSLLSVNHYFVSPNVQQINTLLANQLKLAINGGLLAPEPTENQLVFAATGMKVLSQQQALDKGLDDAIEYASWSEQMSAHLGGPAEVRITLGDLNIYWIRPPHNSDVWISVPIQGLGDQDSHAHLVYLSIIGILSVAGSLWFVRRINRPLKALEVAALEVAKGRVPEPIQEEGAKELIAVTASFNQMAQGIKQLEKDRALLTAGISHDLRTPLTRIRLATEMLPNDQDWIKSGIIDDIDDMNEIIDQFISYVRQDQQEALTSIDLNQLVNDAVQARSLDSESNIELTLTNLPELSLRRVAMRRVIENLIENAFRYGSSRIHISTQYDKHKRQVSLSVRDYGAGIPADKIEGLFEPFTQGDLARGSMGSGLGLAIIKRIVTMHKGTIHLYNHGLGGLVATITLNANLSTNSSK